MSSLSPKYCSFKKMQWLAYQEYTYYVEKIGLDDRKVTNLESTLTSFNISQKEAYAFSFVLLSNFMIFWLESIEKFTAVV